MNHEKYKDPTAEWAIAEAEKWERQQRRLEEKHGIKRGDIIQIIQTSYASGDGKIMLFLFQVSVHARRAYRLRLHPRQRDGQCQAARRRRRCMIKNQAYHIKYSSLIEYLSVLLSATHDLG